MPIGSPNPLPFRVGGGPTNAQRAYTALRQAVGTGGSAPNDRGIEGLWRRSEAKGVAAASSAPRRAYLQAFPHLATDLLPYYERVLGVVPPAGASEAARRAVVLPLWTKRVNNVLPELVDELLAIDPRLSLLDEPHSYAITAQPGRAFAPIDPAAELPVFALERGHALMPGYSTDMVVRVLFTVGYSGPLRESELTIVERVKRLLRGFLPSDCDFTIAADPGSGGTPGQWHVGVSPIGFGGVG